ncbi:MAG: hypothetical protein FK731_05890 [Asgard group archaeon]|nr:hypothetical protein [Asgard group archaeon]
MTIENDFTNDKYLKTLERKIALIFFEDGLWDMIIGFTWIAFGIGSAAYDYLPNPINSLLGPLIFLLGFIGFLLAKRFIIYPRIGIIKHKAKQRKRLILPIIILTFFVMLTITAVILTVLGILTFKGIGIGTAFIFGLIPIVIFSTLAIILNYNRIFIHAAVLGAALFTNEMLHIYGYTLYSGIPLICGGLIIVTMGIVYLVKFLKKYQPVQGEELNAQ